MSNEFTLAITGDAIINRRISVQTEPGFLSLVKVIRDADVGYTQFEGLIHDYDGPEVYPSAVAGWTPMRAPRFVAEELKWAGFDIVSLASNHSLDYSYGGLFATWAAMDGAGLPHAGTGRNLGEARSPAYLDTPKGRVALISMCSTFHGWARAGETRRDVKGRPGLNPLRYYYEVDAATLDLMKQLSVRLGWNVAQVGAEWFFNPPGLRLGAYRMVAGKGPGATTVADEADAEGNLRAIRDARRQADWVLVQLHHHEFEPGNYDSVPPRFAVDFARRCIDAGADVFIGEGSHAQPRGIELYKNKPIFYDPGDFFAMSDTVSKLPADYYLMRGYAEEVRDWQATPADGFDARKALPKSSNPPRDPSPGKVTGSVVAVCSFGTDRALTGLKLHPLTLTHAPRSQCGIPLRAEGAAAKKLIAYLAELSAPFKTTIKFEEGLGVVKV